MWCVWGCVFTIRILQAARKPAKRRTRAREVSVAGGEIRLVSAVEGGGARVVVGAQRVEGCRKKYGWVGKAIRGGNEGEGGTETYLRLGAQAVIHLVAVVRDVRGREGVWERCCSRIRYHWGRAVWVDKDGRQSCQQGY